MFPLIVLNVRVSGSVSRATNITDPKETKRKEIIRNISPIWAKILKRLKLPGVRLFSGVRADVAC